MDYKQEKIFNNLKDRYGLTNKKLCFRQHRNLKEFRFFKLERINPNHRMILWGNLKRKLVHDRQYNKMINVGEITVFGLLLLFDFNIFMYWLYLFSLTLYVYDLIIFNTPKEVINFYVNWYRGRCRKWQNSLCC